MWESSASQTRAAAAAITFSAGSRLSGQREITPSTSLVAVWYSKSRSGKFRFLINTLGRGQRKPRRSAVARCSGFHMRHLRIRCLQGITSDSRDSSSFRNGSKSLDRNSCSASQASGQQHDGGGVEEGAGGSERGLRVLPESTVSTDPSKEPLDHPSAWMDREPDLIGGLADDLDGDGGCARRPLSSKAHIGERLYDERER